MPRYNDDRYGGTRLYVGHLSSRTRTRDLEDLFSRYGRFLGVCPTWRKVVCCLLLRGEVSSLQSLTHDGLTVSGKHFRRVRDVDLKHDFAFVDFSDSRDADDARYGLNGREVDGRRIVVEFARGGPRGSGSSSSREFLGRGPPPGTGRCFNCGIDGHWARDCKAGDWKNKCYRCGERGHIERNCQNSPKSLKRADSRSRSPSRSPKRRRGRSRSRSYSRSRSRSYSRSRSPPGKHRHDAAREERSRSPKPKTSPVPSRGKSQSPSPDRRRSVSPVGSSPPGRREISPPVGVEDRRHARERHYSDYDVSPRNNRSPSLEEQGAAGGGYGSPEAANGRNGRSSPPVHDDGDDDRIPFDEDGSPAGNNLSPRSDD